MTAQEQKSIYTFEEYLELEKDTDERLEYDDGKVSILESDTKLHNRIVGNIAGNFLKSFTKKYQVYAESVKLELSKNKQYVYPDVMLTCHPQDLEDETESMIRYPSLLVEVISETTEAYDQGGKKLAYSRLEGLLYYVLVWQTTTTIEVFERQDGSRSDNSQSDNSQSDNLWSYRNYSSKEEQIDFPLLGFSILVGDLYQ